MPNYNLSSVELTELFYLFINYIKKKKRKKIKNQYLLECYLYVLNPQRKVRKGFYLNVVNT